MPGRGNQAEKRARDLAEPHILGESIDFALRGQIAVRDLPRR